MILRIKTLIISLLVATTLFFGYRATRYFFDHTCPVVSVVGLEEGGVYAGDIACMLHGSDGYGVRSLSLWLDNSALVEHHKINRRIFQYPFLIPTQSLSDGKHKLKITVIDSSYRSNVTEKEITFLVDNVPLRAAFTAHNATFKVHQGNTLHIQFQVNKPLKEALVEVLSGKYGCCQEDSGSLIYDCFVPIKSDEQPNEYPFTIQIVDRVGNRGVIDGKLDVVGSVFPKQQLKVGKEKLEKEAAVSRSEREFEKILSDLSTSSPRKRLWKGAFYAPCDIRAITTQFGTLRTSQERGMYRHNGIDIAAAPKSIVWAAQDGTVVLKDRFLYSGNTIIIDHGCGIMTLYYHLDSFADITVGDIIKKGNPIGRVGMTGYASGYHLHWELRINNIPVNPLQWIEYSF